MGSLICNKSAARNNVNTGYKCSERRVLATKRAYGLQRQDWPKDDNLVGGNQSRGRAQGLREPARARPAVAGVLVRARVRVCVHRGLTRRRKRRCAHSKASKRARSTSRRRTSAACCKTAHHVAMPRVHTHDRCEPPQLMQWFKYRLPNSDMQPCRRSTSVTAPYMTCNIGPRAATWGAGLQRSAARCIQV
jgi:hypothetical protein